MKRSVIVDISFWQDNPDTIRKVDFGQMRLAGADGVIFRIGQATWEDKKFKEYWKTSENMGLLRGGYWYYDNSVSPKVQAQLCVKILKENNCKLNLPLFADFEDKRTGLPFPFRGWKNWYDFIEELKRLLPDQMIGVYTGYYYWMENKPFDVSKEKYFSQYPLWLAQYPYEYNAPPSSYKEPKIPPIWNSWEIWQVSDRGDGDYFGVESSRIDVNYFNGDVIALQSKYGVAEESEEIISKPPTRNLLRRDFSVFYENKKVIF